MELAAIYKSPRFLELADMIENHELATERLLRTLDAEFPPPNGMDWEIDSKNRPVLRGKN
jgi:hypothetical protein